MISRCPAVTRYSNLYFSPDPLGDLLFNGIAQTASRQSVATGLQGDGSYRISDVHTLRSGFYIQRERSDVQHQFGRIAGRCERHSNQRPAVHDLRFERHDRLALQLLPAGRMAVVPKVTINFGARFDQMAEFRQRAAAEPAR